MKQKVRFETKYNLGHNDEAPGLSAKLSECVAIRFFDQEKTIPLLKTLAEMFLNTHGLKQHLVRLNNAVLHRLLCYRLKCTSHCKSF
jgi:hypothetical protein